MLQIFFNCLYLWSYKFSGAMDWFFTIEPYWILQLFLQNYILLYMGIYFLTIILKGYDLVDFIVNREKIREKSYGQTAVLVINL